MEPIFNSALLPTRKHINDLIKRVTSLNGTPDEMEALVDLGCAAKRLLGLVERIHLPKKVFAVRLKDFDIELAPFIGYQDIDTVQSDTPTGKQPTAQIWLQGAGKRITFKATAKNLMSLGEFSRVADELRRDDKTRAFEIQIREVGDEQ